MDRLRNLAAFIQSRLAMLTTSQRIAIGMCAALIGISFVWLLQWSTTPDWVPLVTKEFSYGELENAEQALRGNNIAFETSGTTLLVKEADRHNALRLLHAANALPEGSLFDMAAAVANQNPFQPPEQREYAHNYAMGNELAQIITTSPLVREARVILNQRTKRRLGTVPEVPTASLAITLQPGQEMNDSLVEGFAKLVAGAVSGLKPHNVAITDVRTGRSWSLPGPEDSAGLDALSLEKKREDHLRAKILGALADVPGVRVAVRVDLDSAKRVTQKIRHDSPQPKMESTQSSETSGGGGAAESGVQANLGQSITENAPSQSNTMEDSKVENFEPKLSQTETVEQFPYAVKKVTAAVGIPRSFIAGVFRLRHPEKPEPKDDEPEFAALRDEQVKWVRASVEKIVMARNTDDVEVAVFPDVEWSADGGSWSRQPGAPPIVEARSDGMDTFGLLRTYGPQAGLGFLAMMSLFFVSRLANRASTVTSGAFRSTGRPGSSATQEPILSSGAAPIGQAVVSSDSVLTAREVDDDTLRYQELGEEVSKLVESDPEGTAALIRRWVEEP